MTNNWTIDMRDIGSLRSAAWKSYESYSFQLSELVGIILIMAFQKGPIGILWVCYGWTTSILKFFYIASHVYVCNGKITTYVLSSWVGNYCSLTLVIMYFKLWYVIFIFWCSHSTVFPIWSSCYTLSVHVIDCASIHTSNTMS